MSATKVTLYIRVTLPDGKRPYLNPVFAGNKSLKEGWGELDGKPQRFKEYAYYLRYLKEGKRIYERLGSKADEAIPAKRRTELRLRAADDGIELPPDQPAIGRITPPSSSRPLLDCIAAYKAETKAHKSAKTQSAYRETLLTFLEAADSGRKDTQSG
jgi:hypothetical protein